MTEPERRVTTTDDLLWILNQIHLGPSSPLQDVVFVAGPARGDSDQIGWLVSFTFVVRDRDTGARARVQSRAEYVPAAASRSEVVKTVWVLFELAVRHELMEAFHFQGQRIFDPHVDVKDLSTAALRRGSWR